MIEFSALLVRVLVYTQIPFYRALRMNGAAKRQGILESRRDSCQSKEAMEGKLAYCDKWPFQPLPPAKYRLFLHGHGWLQLVDLLDESYGTCEPDLWRA